MKDEILKTRPRTLHTSIIKLNKAHRRKALEEFGKVGITEGQPKILCFLSQNDGCIQRQLAESCLIEPATVSSILANMEKSGLIYRSPNPKDRRVLNVFLTAKGKEAHLETEKVFSLIDEECFIGFSMEERNQTIDFFDRLHKNIEKKGDAHV